MGLPNEPVLFADASQGRVLHESGFTAFPIFFLCFHPAAPRLSGVAACYFCLNGRREDVPLLEWMPYKTHERGSHLSGHYRSGAHYDNHQVMMLWVAAEA